MGENHLNFIIFHMLIYDEICLVHIYDQ